MLIRCLFSFSERFFVLFEHLISLSHITLGNLATCQSFPYGSPRAVILAIETSPAENYAFSLAGEKGRTIYGWR